VGEVLRAGLGTDAQEVVIQAAIYQSYAALVRENSVFWNAGGVNFSLGLHGADISAQSVKALVAGGIAFATPNTTGQPARNGTTFRLHEKQQDEWLAWHPAIPLTGKTGGNQ
jgi:paraquat-inducible protein B